MAAIGSRPFEQDEEAEQPGQQGPHNRAPYRFWSLSI
jgi:hypothetical protein